MKLKSYALLTIGGAIGAAIMHFRDPDVGRSRRSRAADQLASQAHKALGQVGVKAKMQVGRTWGAINEKLRTEATPENDATLAHKVESEALGGSFQPSRPILVNAEAGTVVLRGVLDTQAEIDAIVDRVRQVGGVLDVRCLIRTQAEAEAPASAIGSNGR